MGAIASQTTSLTIVYSTVDSDADQREYQSSASLAFVRGIHQGPVNSPHKCPLTRKMFPFDDVIMMPYHPKNACGFNKIANNNIKSRFRKKSHKMWYWCLYKLLIRNVSARSTEKGRLSPAFGGDLWLFPLWSAIFLQLKWWSPHVPIYNQGFIFVSLVIIRS